MSSYNLSEDTGRSGRRRGMAERAVPRRRSNTTISPQETPNRRNTELALLVFAILLPVLAYANVGLAMDDKLPAGMLGYGFGMGALALVAHLLMRRFAPYADPLMLPIATLLNGLGVVMIWRLDKAGKLLHNNYPAAANQLMWSGLGVAFFIAVMVFLKDHRVLQRYTYISMVAALVLLAAPAFFPWGNPWFPHEPPPSGGRRGRPDVASRPAKPASGRDALPLTPS